MPRHCLKPARSWISVLLFSAAFYGCAEVGRMLSVPAFPYVSFWLPAGLCVGVFLLNETCTWPWFMLAAAPANFLFDHWSGTPFATTVGFYGANMLEAATGAWLVRRWVAPKPSVATLREFLGLLGCAAVVGSMLGAVVGAATLTASGMSHSFWHSWLTWWGNEAMAISLLTPAILVWGSKPESKESPFKPRGKLLEATLLTAALAGLAWYMLVWDRGINAPYKSQLLPLLLWAGLRFGMRGATAANLLLALLMGFLTTHFLKGLTSAEIVSGSYVATMQSFLMVSVIIVLIPTIILRESKQAEEAQRKSEAEFRVTFEHAAIGMALVDLAGHPLQSNRALQQLLGYSNVELQGMDFTQFTHPEDVGADLGLFHELIQGQRESYQIEKRYLRKSGGTIFARLTVSAVRSLTGTAEFAIGMVEDITDRRRLEEQLRQAQKMEALGTLAGGTAHEFNNMLAIIIGFTELSKSELEAQHPVQANLAEVLQASQRAREIVEQVLTFSRQQKQERSFIQLQDVALEAVKHVRKLVPKTVEIRSDISVDDLSILGNPTQIHQVITNICINAWHALDGDTGWIKVVQKSVTLNRAASEIHPSLSAGTYLWLCISDNGKGMDSATLARIFEPFFTTKAPGKGSGLGLAVVHGIMQSHDGAVLAHSEPGQGTTFELYFPARPDACSKPAATPSSPICQGHGQHILVVDDEPSLTRVAAKCLKRLGYRATEAHSATEALEVCHRLGGEIDLVITDLTMPNLDGIGLANALYAVRPSLPLILATGFDGAKAAESDHPPNLRNLMQKPYTAEILAKTIHSILTGHGERAKYSAARASEPVAVQAAIPTPDTERLSLIPGMGDRTKLALVGTAKTGLPESGPGPKRFNVKTC